MNLWDIKREQWDETLLKLAGGDSHDLQQMLGQVRLQTEGTLGSISPYFVERYGFPRDCKVSPFTGDNPATILSLPLRPLDAIVSLGTSTTFLMSTPAWVPNPQHHLFNHPTTSGLYMLMLCYKNGGLAREKVRDAVNNTESAVKVSNDDQWAKFNYLINNTPPLGTEPASTVSRLGLFFPLPEIVPNCRAGNWRFCYDAESTNLTKVKGSSEKYYAEDVRTIVESQVLSLRLRSRSLVNVPGNKRPQPRRIYLVGGGSQNMAITKIIGEVLGGADGVYKLDVPNACALGGAYKVLWAVEGGNNAFEDFIAQRWDEGSMCKKIHNGYTEGVFEQYGTILPMFEKMETLVLEESNADR
jgi:xylulokinase